MRRWRGEVPGAVEEMLLLRNRAQMLRFRCGLLCQVKDVLAVLLSAKWAKLTIAGYSGNDALAALEVRKAPL